MLQTNQKISDFAQQVAEAIGDARKTDDVETVIEASNNGHHIIYGIKDARFLPDIQREGVKNNSPEGGQVSYWTSGKNIFGETGPSGRLSGFDSTFFQYSHARTGKPNHETMAVAITNEETIQKHHPDKTFKFKQDGYLQIPFPLNREDVTVLTVDVELPKGETLSDRQVAQIGERHLLKALKDCLTDGYTPGRDKPAHFRL